MNTNKHLIMMLLKGTAFGLCIAGLGLFATACNDKPKEEEQQGSTGGEDFEGEHQGSNEGERQGEGSINTGESIATGSTTTGPTSTESPWGRPEGETGEPLPQRREMSGSAVSSNRSGLEAGNNGNNDEARRQFERALASDPSAFEALYNLGVLAERLGQYERALEYYRQSLRIQADYEMAIKGVASVMIRRADAQGAVTFVEPLARRWERNLYVTAVYGETLIAANRIEDGISAARRALRRDEKFVPAMLVIVKANLKLGRIELAESVLDQALVISPNLGELHFLKGKIQEGQKLTNMAMESYKNAVRYSKEHVESHVALALLLMRGGNYPEAVSELEVAQRLSPQVLAIRLNLGEAYRSSRQWTKAKAEFDKVIEMDPRQAEVHYNLGLLYLGAGDQFPGLDALTSLQRAQGEFNAYRELMGSRLARDDDSKLHLEEIARSIERVQRQRERDAARRQREAERAARQAQPSE